MTYDRRCRKGMGNPQTPNKMHKLTRNALDKRSNHDKCNRWNILVAPKQYTGTMGTLCLRARRRKPLRITAYSSCGNVFGLGYPSNISAIPPGTTPIRFPSNKAWSTDDRDASLCRERIPKRMEEANGTV